MIRSKGEAGTGNIVEAVRHLRSILGDIRAAHPGRRGRAVRAGPRTSPRPSTLVQEVADDRAPAGPAVLRRAASPPRPTPRSSCSSAPRRSSWARGSSRARTRRAGPRAIVEATTHFDDAADRGQGQPRAWARRCAGRGDRRARPSAWPTAAGDARAARCPGDDRGPRPPGRRPRALAALAELGVDRPDACARPRTSRARRDRSCPAASRRRCRCCSTSSGLCDPLAEELAGGPAGARHLRGPDPARRPRCVDGRADQRCFGALDSPCAATATAARSSPSRRRRGGVALAPGAVPAVFIRAPLVERGRAGVEVLARAEPRRDGRGDPVVRAAGDGAGPCVPPRAHRRPPRARGSFLGRSARGRSSTRDGSASPASTGDAKKEKDDVRPLEVGDHQAPQGRAGQGPGQGLRQADPPGRGRRPRGRRRRQRQRHPAHHVPEGPRRLGAARHDRARHQAGHRRARGRPLRGGHLRGLRARRRRDHRRVPHRQPQPHRRRDPQPLHPQRRARWPSPARSPGSSSARASIVVAGPSTRTSSWRWPSRRAPRT